MKYVHNKKHVYPHTHELKMDPSSVSFIICIHLYLNMYEIGISMHKYLFFLFRFLFIFIISLFLKKKSFQVLSWYVNFYYSASKSPFSNLLKEYVEAENRGKFHGECWPYFKDCPKSLFRLSENKYMYVKIYIYIYV